MKNEILTILVKQTWTLKMLKNEMSLNFKKCIFKTQFYVLQLLLGIQIRIFKMWFMLQF